MTTLSVVSALCATLVLAACGTSTGATSPSPQEARVATYHSGGKPYLASLPGVLVVRDGCVHVENEGGSALPIFRAKDVRWVDGALEYEGKTYAVGDFIDLMGGRSELDDLVGLSIPPECETDSYFVVAPSE